MGERHISPHSFVDSMDTCSDLSSPMSFGPLGQQTEDDQSSQSQHELVRKHGSLFCQTAAPASQKPLKQITGTELEDNSHDHIPEQTNRMNGRASLGYHSQSHMKKTTGKHTSGHLVRNENRLGQIPCSEQKNRLDKVSGPKVSDNLHE